MTLGLDIEKAGPEPEVVEEVGVVLGCGCDQPCPRRETRVRSLRRLIKLYDTEITKLDVRIAEVFKDDEGYQMIQQLNGVGPVIAAIFWVELGDVEWSGQPEQSPPGRDSPRDTASRTPRCIEGRSPNKAHHWSGGRRWKPSPKPRRRPHQGPLPACRSPPRKEQGRVAAARQLLTMVHYGRRDPEPRSARGHVTGGRGRVTASSVSAWPPCVGVADSCD